MIDRFSLTLAGLVFAAGVLAQTDTAPPQLNCKAAVYLPVLCSGEMNVTAMLDTLFDDTTPAQDIQLGIRKICTGQGFPENSVQLPFHISEYYARIEVWGRDQSGNVSHCFTNVIVTDMPGYFCDPGIAIMTVMPNGKGIAEATIDIVGNHCYFPSIHHQYETYELVSLWGNGGIWDIGLIAPAAGYQITITTTKDLNPLNGLSTFDLVLIQKHILGIQPLDSPYKIIAADANQDGQVTSYDILILKNLLLGITTELPNDRSWRFVPQGYAFPDPANPFAPAFSEQIVVVPSDPLYNDVKLFYGVKIGDVDYSANPGQ